MTNPEMLSQRWDLDAVFPGGSGSPAFAAHLEGLERDVAALGPRIAATPVPAAGAPTGPWTALLADIQDLVLRLRQGAAFANCLCAQDVRDEQARALMGRVRQLAATFMSALSGLDEAILAIPDPDWQALLAQPDLAPIAFPLAERRRRVAAMLPPAQEALVTALAVDGYHGWSELYNQVVGRITIPFAENGQTVRLSVGQAENRLRSSDRAVRSELFARWEEAWADAAELCAAALNHLAGFRLNLYRRRGWDSVLAEPLDINRMQPETLDAMWAAVTAGKDRLAAFLARKARLLGVQRLTWHDAAAPLPFRADRRIGYDEAAGFIVDQFRRFSPRLADFAHTAFTQGWIEAENRPGKRPGGFCANLPLSRQSRIFLTFDGLPVNVNTLAHELGHAYHQHLVNDLPALAQDYAMNVAETASTFAEAIVMDAALAQATDPEERLALLGEKAERAISFLLNIHARFLFELDFYAARGRGPVAVAQLNELMQHAQQRAYAGALAEYHPYFWASKLHFYITSVPFYNFPYTFGYLFSTGIYARARAEGPAFAPRYEALLRDTGRMTVEDLAARHLGVDLRRPDFWQAAVDAALADIDTFLRLTDPGAG